MLFPGFVLHTYSVYPGAACHPVGIRCLSVYVIVLLVPRQKDLEET